VDCCRTTPASLGNAGRSTFPLRRTSTTFVGRQAPAIRLRECRTDFAESSVSIMDAMKASPRWGTMSPTWDRGGPSLLIGEASPGADRPTTLYGWWPPADIEGELPRGFGLPVRCHTGADGLRRFAPVGMFDSFVAGAWAGGFALLCRDRRLTPRGASELSSDVVPVPSRAQDARALSTVVRLLQGLRSQRDRAVGGA